MQISGSRTRMRMSSVVIDPRKEQIYIKVSSAGNWGRRSEIDRSAVNWVARLTDLQWAIFKRTTSAAKQQSASIHYLVSLTP